MSRPNETMLGDLADPVDENPISIELPIDDDDPKAVDPMEIEDDGAPAAARTNGGGETRSASSKRKVVMALPIDIVVAVGRARPLLSELAGLRRDSVLALDSRIDDPVELLVGDKVIARGELQEIEPETGRLGVRLTEVADPQESV